MSDTRRHDAGEGFSTRAVHAGDPVRGVGNPVVNPIYQTSTFFSDPAGGRLMEDFGQDNFMWSSDYPHAASTWPHSRSVIARELGHLPKATIDKVVRNNVIDLYHLKVDGINNN